jgi:flagellar biosynthesis/type III secretory pathway chaperone
MSLWPELITLVETFEQIQSDLGLVLEGKEQALRSGNSGELLGFAQREGALTQRLQAFAAARQKLLADARRQGLPSESLQSLSGAIGGSQGAAVRERLTVASGRSARLRRQSWCHWILAHRSYHHYSQLLEMIAHGGQKPPTYTDSPSPATGGRGGVVLDASV